MKLLGFGYLTTACAKKTGAAASVERHTLGDGTRSLFPYIFRVAILACAIVLLTENVHALKGLACRKRVAPASSPAAPASRVRRLRLRQAFLRMLWSQNNSKC